MDKDRVEDEAIQPNIAQADSSERHCDNIDGDGRDDIWNLTQAISRYAVKTRTYRKKVDCSLLLYSSLL